MKYYIYKNYRNVSLEQSSYCGPAWDGAGIRDQYQEYWDNPEIPLELVKKLNKENIVGFAVYGINRLI